MSGRAQQRRQYSERLESAALSANASGGGASEEDDGAILQPRPVCHSKEAFQAPATNR